MIRWLSRKLDLEKKIPTTEDLRYSVSLPCYARIKEGDDMVSTNRYIRFIEISSGLIKDSRIPLFSSIFSKRPILNTSYSFSLS
jgi:hypothetical protein